MRPVPTFDFDPLDPAFVADPHPVLRRNRPDCPVTFLEGFQGWAIMRHADVKAVLASDAVSVSRQNWKHTPPRPDGYQLTPLEAFTEESMFRDGADHTRMRRLFSAAFTPAQVARQEDTIRRIVDTALDACGTTFDVVNDYVAHVPIRVISALLGIPDGREAEFRHAAQMGVRAINPFLTPEETEEANAALAATGDIINTLIDEKREKPADDLISAMIAARDDGDRFSDVEMQSLAVGLLLGGAETVVHATSLCVFGLQTEHLWDRFASDPAALCSQAFSEGARFNQPGTFLYRFSLEPLVVGGVEIGANEMLMCSLSSAARDEDAVENADMYDLDRATPETIPFGYGPHYCFGAALARLEGAIMLERLGVVHPRLKIVDEPEFCEPSPLFRGLARLSVAS